jgi:hypothetical protein
LLRFSFFSTILLLLSTAVLPLNAHNGGTLLLTGQVVGQYRVWVWGDPVPFQLGTNHLTISVNLAAVDQPITNAQVLVKLRPISASADLASLAFPAETEHSLNKIFFEADLELVQSGDYQAEIVIDGPAGVEQIGLMLTVLPAKTTHTGWFYGLGMLILLFIGYFQWRKHLHKHR